MAESTASVNRSLLYRHVGRVITGSDDIADADANETQWIKDIIDSGLRNFYVGGSTRHQWSFLQPLTTLETVAAYSTGTITIAAGTVTLDSGTWPSWAADGDLTVGGNTYTVATRTSDSVIVLDDTSVTAAAGSAYQLGQATYDLPDDCAYIEGPFTYAPGTATMYGPIDQISEVQVRQHRQWTETISRPQAYTFEPIPHTLSTTASNRYRVRFWPTPDAAYLLTYRYRVRLDSILAADNYPVGSEEHAETLIAAVRATCELESENQKGHWDAHYKELLEASIAIDAQTRAEYLGYNDDKSERTDLDARLQSRAPGSYVQYEGHTLIQ